MTKKELAKIIRPLVKEIVREEINVVLVETLVKTVAKEMLTEVPTRQRPHTASSSGGRIRRRTRPMPHVLDNVEEDDDIAVEEARQQRQESLEAMRAESMNGLTNHSAQVPEGMEALFEGTVPLSQNAMQQPSIPEVDMDDLKEIGVNMNFAEHVERL